MITVKNRKKIARLKREIKELEDKAFKTEGFCDNEERFNTRYETKLKQLIKLGNGK